MTEKRPQQGRTRLWIDMIATVAILTTCGILTYTALAQPKRRTKAPFKLPSTAVSLEGASLTGSLSAKIAIIEFSDFQCPFCGRFTRETWPELEKTYVASGKVLFAFRHLPADSIHPLARPASEAAICAGQQEQFWKMADLLFQVPSQLDESAVRRKIDELGLNRSAFEACLKLDGPAQVKADSALASGLSIPSTPFFLIGRLQADRTVVVTSFVRAAQPIATFVADIETALAEIK